jgi:hypothetical protein
MDQIKQAVASIVAQETEKLRGELARANEYANSQAARADGKETVLNQIRGHLGNATLTEDQIAKHVECTVRDRQEYFGYLQAIAAHLGFNWVIFSGLLGKVQESTGAYAHAHDNQADLDKIAEALGTKSYDHGKLHEQVSTRLTQWRGYLNAVCAASGEHFYPSLGKRVAELKAKAERADAIAKPAGDPRVDKMIEALRKWSRGYELSSALKDAGL